MIGGLRAAASFLTRVPSGKAVDGRRIARSLPWFPVIGAVIGLAVAGVHAGAVQVWPPLVSATLAVAVGVAATGALHEDGLGDLADAFGAGSGEAARRAVSDPRLGTYGVLALALATVVRVGTLAGLEPVAALLWVPAAHAASRGAAVGLLVWFPAAPGEGLGAGLAAEARTAPALAAAVVGSGLAVAAVGWWGLAASALTLACVLGVGTAGARRLGGVTGDVVGAAQQVAEIGVLLLAAGAAAGWAPPPWWP